FSIPLYILLLFLILTYFFIFSYLIINFTLIRPSARSTLFPYTTLFRSWNKALLDNAARPSGALVYSAGGGQLTQEQFERLKAELDRKSTRLNSSHVKISYAVFCLKKKNLAELKFHCVYLTQYDDYNSLD